MNWIYANKENVKSISNYDFRTTKRVLHLSINNKTVSDENSLRFILKIVNDVPSILELQNILIPLQKEYDTCDEVNVFYVNGKKCWFDKATRVGLISSINLEKYIDKKDTTIWFGNNPITMSISKAIAFLRELEIYAMECYNVTQKHIVEINNTETIEELLEFDITKDYPEPLKFTFE